MRNCNVFQDYEDGTHQKNGIAGKSQTSYPILEEETLRPLINDKMGSNVLEEAKKITGKVQTNPSKVHEKEDQMMDISNLKLNHTVNKMIKLSGAARKRYKWFRGHGLNHEEAQTRAQMPMNLAGEDKHKKNCKEAEKTLKGDQAEMPPQVAEKKLLQVQEQLQEEELLKSQPTSYPTLTKEKECLKSLLISYKMVSCMSEESQKERSIVHSNPSEVHEKEIKILDISNQKLKLSENEKIKHSGATRKRCSSFRGHVEAQARAQIETTLKRFVQKVKVENDSTQSFSSGECLGEPISANIIKMLKQVKLGVLHTNYPNTLLSVEQMKMIQESILTAIVDQKEGPVKPNFQGASFRSGWMMVTCGDNQTAMWLQNLCRIISPWEGASLKTVAKDEFPQEHLAVAFLPNSKEDSPERILALLRGQNRNLNVKEWRVVASRKEGEMAILTVSVDKESAKTIESQNRVNFKFGHASIHIKKTKVDSTFPEMSDQSPCTSKNLSALADFAIHSNLVTEPTSDARVGLLRDRRDITHTLDTPNTSFGADGVNVLHSPLRSECIWPFRTPLNGREGKFSKAAINPHMPSRKGPWGGRKRK